MQGFSQAINKTIVIVFLSLLMVPVRAFALPSSLDNLASQIKQKRYEQAYRLSHSLFDQHAGTPEFDFLNGIAAIHTDHTQEAVFAFERVLAQRPNSVSARVQLAFAYFKIRNYSGAEQELTRVLKLDLPPQQHQKAQQYLRQIQLIKTRQGSHSLASVGLRLGYDTNINNGTELDSVVIPVLGEIELFAESQATEDQFFAASGRYRSQHQLTQNSRLWWQLNAEAVQYDSTSRLDRQIATLAGGYQNQWQGANYRFSSYWQPLRLNGTVFRQAAGLNLTRAAQLTPNWRWLVKTGMGWVDNRQSSTRDYRQYHLQLGLSSTGSLSHHWQLGYHFDDAYKQTADFNTKRYWQANYRLRWQFNDHRLQGQLNYKDARYRAPHPTQGITRDEQHWRLTLTYRYQLTPSVTLGSKASLGQRNSNAPLYDYDKSTLSVTGRYHF